MKSFILFLCTILAGVSPSANGQSVNDRIVSALKENDHATLTGYLHSMVDLQIPGYSGNFSQNQASAILKQFFSDHPVDTVTVSREGDNSDGSRYTLGELVSKGKRYRLYFVTRETEGKRKALIFQIIET